MRFLKFIAISHATYILVTAIWPIVHIESFMLVTGPKTDIWLVKTVGALLLPIGMTMLILFLRGDRKTLIFLGSAIAIAFIIIDVYYSLRDVISDIYLWDAGLEFSFLIAWAFVAFRKPSR